jgi:hypothetical protein
MEVLTMLLSVFENRFEKARLDAWQGYALLDFQEGDDDPRNDCFEKLKATIDAVPAPLQERAGDFFSDDAARFHYFMSNLTEEVGMSYLPESASEFVTELVQRLETPNPEDSWQWTRSESEEEDVAFAEIDHLVPPTRTASGTDLGNADDLRPG